MLKSARRPNRIEDKLLHIITQSGLSAAVRMKYVAMPCDPVKGNGATARTHLGAAGASRISPATSHARESVAVLPDIARRWSSLRSCDEVKCAARPTRPVALATLGPIRTSPQR
jgi:hypothetical protein